MTSPERSERRQGVVADWNDERGFGFITPAEGGSRVFVHISAFPRGRRPVVGCEVSYTPMRDERNRARAAEVRYVGRGPANRSGPGKLPLAVAIAMMFFGILGLLVALDLLSVVIVGLYVLLSAFALLSYFVDKSAARNGQWQISGANLHTIALLGGWPGALIGQQAFRHKTTKQPFQTIFWVTVLVNCAALAWFVNAAPIALP